MICLLALVIFGILGIFSARYRIIAKEAVDCVFRRVTFRKCTSGLDSRLKSQITGSLMRRSPTLAGFVYRRFEIISWIFTAVMIWSIVFSAISLFNYVQYGNCNGKSNGEGFCIFDPLGNSKFSTFIGNYSGPAVMPDEGNSPALGPKEAPVLIIEFGCYRCPYTKRVEPVVSELLQRYKGAIRFVYRDFPLEAKHANSSISSQAARCAADQGMFWEYHHILFDKQNMTGHNQTLLGIASDLGMNLSQFTMCLDSGQHASEVFADFEAGIKAGIYGTPTFFINNRSLVGPRPFNDFTRIIDEEIRERGLDKFNLPAQAVNESEDGGLSCEA